MQLIFISIYDNLANISLYIDSIVIQFLTNSYTRYWIYVPNDER